MALLLNHNTNIKWQAYLLQNDFKGVFVFGANNINQVPRSKEDKAFGAKSFLFGLNFLKSVKVQFFIEISDKVIFGQLR